MSVRLAACLVVQKLQNLSRKGFDRGLRFCRIVEPGRAWHTLAEVCKFLCVAVEYLVDCLRGLILGETVAHIYRKGLIVLIWEFIKPEYLQELISQKKVSFFRSTRQRILLRLIQAPKYA